MVRTWPVIAYALLAFSMQNVCTDQDVHCAASCSTIPCRDKLLAGGHPDVTTRHDLKFQLVLFVKHSQDLSLCRSALRHT